ncbi:hypothetical protein QDX21_10930 [Auritidibacter ignavus]|uniref:Uncharacterized protein n=1 Tax=Auritidibacter ignavus TaxID=678932 RepID=A0AAJ6DDJ0_9MICC|nr:hypothetical protein [Auritidibacter ignavus]WGH94544.1 hypothetical protein QDX21_10930 [Auritidibacter ignavus]
MDSRRPHKATVALSAIDNAYLINHTAELIAALSRRTTGSVGMKGMEQTRNGLVRDYQDTHGRPPWPLRCHCFPARYPA